MAEGQLALPFPYTPALTGLEFLPHPGVALALEFLAATPTWPQRRLAIWGESGAGKTHLVHLWSEDRGAAIVSGPALVEPFWPESAVAIDDADRVGSEEALLHVLNAAGEAGRPVLLSMTRAPARIGFKLPDLSSRVRAMTAIGIGAGDDGFLRMLFARLLSERQLPVAPALQEWVLVRLARTPAAVREAVARLDYAALAAKSGVTYKLAGEALAGMLHQDTSRPEFARNVEETSS